MEEYSNLVVQCELLSEKERLAGFHEKWGRSMVLACDNCVREILDSRKSAVAIVIPASAINKEKIDMKKRAEKYGCRIIDEICSPLGIAEYYVSQGNIEAGDKDIFVVDMWNTFTDVCVIRNEQGIRRIKDVHRIDFGFSQLEDFVMNFFEVQFESMKVGMLSDFANQELLRGQIRELIRRMIYSRTLKENIRMQPTNRKKACYLQIRRLEFDKIIGDLISLIISSINRVRMIHQVEKGKLILSGDLFAYAGAVKSFKSRISVQEILSYKAEDVAVLGAAEYSRKKHGCGRCIVIDYLDILYSQQIRRGGYSNLNVRQQKAYKETLTCIMNRKPEAIFVGFSKDVLPVYSALREDFPEVDIIWDYSMGQVWEYKGTVKLALYYRQNSTEMLNKINCVVNGILAENIERKGMTDTQILKAVYHYISNHYHYIDEHLQNGGFPDHAYTLETLLRHGVCHGYAISMLYIFRHIQIPVIYICGDAEAGKFGGHAWNIIQMTDGNWRHLDVTWDLGKNRGNMCHLLLDDLEMKSRKHFWETLKYPECE